MEQATDSSQTQQFSSSEVKVTIHRKPACLVEFEVESSKELVEKAYKSAIKDVAKEVSLPGFRKGKAPDDMVVKNYPKEVDRRWQECIADLAFRESGKLANVPLLQKDSRVTFKMKSHSHENASLTLTFETHPVIPTVDPKTITLKKVERPAVNDEKVQETIRQMLFFFAEWKPVTDRPVKEGDYAMLDVDVVEETPATPLFSNTRFEVSDKGMAKWMKDLVVGQTAGASREGVSVADTDATEAEKKEFKPKKVRVVIRSIQEATLPALDDSFAKKVGVANLDELNQSITRLLNDQANAHVRQALRDQASEALLIHYAFDLPASLIERETHFRMKQLLADTQFQKHWQGLSDDEKRKMVDSLYQQSQKAVRMFYLCRKIIADAKISITAEDLPKPPSTPLEVLVNPTGALHDWNQNPEIQHAEAFSRLVLEKAEDYVIDNAVQA